MSLVLVQLLARRGGANARCVQEGLPEAHSLDLDVLVSIAGSRANDARIEAAAVEEREAPPYNLCLEHVRLPRRGRREEASRWRLWGEAVEGVRHEGAAQYGRGKEEKKGRNVEREAKRKRAAPREAERAASEAVKFVCPVQGGRNRASEPGEAWRPSLRCAALPCPVA
jgi:hypothetical protein